MTHTKLIVMLLLAAIVEPTLSQEKSAVFLLPDFATPDYECDGLRAAILQRQPIAGKDAYAVVLNDQGGAEFKGDLAGMVGWKVDSTVTIVGTLTIHSCKEGGPAPIVIVSNNLKFSVTAQGRLAYLEGAGTVSQNSVTTKLPLKTAPNAKPRATQSSPTTAR